MFLPDAVRQWSFVSTSLVKEVATFGGDVTGLVPDCGPTQRLVTSVSLSATA